MAMDKSKVAFWHMPGGMEEDCRQHVMIANLTTGF